MQVHVLSLWSRHKAVAACGLLLAVAVSAAQASSDVATSKIAFVRFTPRTGHPRIYTVGADGRSLRALRLPVAAAEAPAWSRDGRKLAFNVPGVGSIRRRSGLLQRTCGRRYGLGRKPRSVAAYRRFIAPLSR